MRTISSSILPTAQVQSKVMGTNAVMPGELFFDSEHLDVLIKGNRPRLIRMVTSNNFSVHDLILVDCEFHHLLHNTKLTAI